MGFPTIIQQEQRDCGVTCIQMILKYYGSELPIHKLRQLSSTNSEGVSGLGIKNCFEKLNFECLTFKAESNFWFNTQLENPLIAHIVNENGFSHFVIVYKLKKGYIHISDPAKGKYKQSIDQFNNVWTGVLFSPKPNSDYQAINEKTKGIESFKYLITKNKKHIVVVTFLSLLITILGIISSFYFQIMIDYVIPFNELNLVTLYSVTLIFINLLRPILFYIRSQLLNWLSINMNKDIMMSYFKHTLNLPLIFYTTRKTGDIISRFSDASKIIEGIASTVITVFLDIVMCMLIGAVLFSISSRLFLITLMIVPVLALVIVLFVDKIDKNKNKEMRLNASLNTSLIESYKGIETIKAYNSEKNNLINIQEVFQKYLQSSFNNEKIINLQNAIKQGTFLVFNAVILWLGTVYVMNDLLTIGELITYVSLLTFFVTSIENIINLQNVLQTAEVASKRINEVMLIEPESSQETSTITLKNHEKINTINISNLSFSYDLEKPALIDINLHLDFLSSKNIAFVGKSGTGKSTLAKLLVKFYSNYDGNIYINNANLMSIDSSVIREKITYVAQDTYLFSGTLYNNLIFGLEKKPSEEELVKALSIAHIYEDILNLPQGLNAHIEEGGENLSGGQKRRIDIARAILSESEIIIFDEITNGMDPILETKIIKSITSYEPKKNIFITHNPLISDQCDQIYVFEDKQIIESGEPENLDNSHSIYGRVKNQMYST